MELNCTLLLGAKDNPLAVNELKEKLESNSDEDKILAIKHITSAVLNGDPMRDILIHVIRFCATSKNQILKKLLMVYWEVVDKRGPDGKLLPEMILVCNAMRNDLNHPNEYIRGCTLRLCTKLREKEILEPLIPSITGNLSHRHSFVRRNAILTVFAVFKTFPELIPDAANLVANMLEGESDLNAKRNGFLMLFHCDQDKAIAFMNRILDQVPSMGDGTQLVVLELTRKICRARPQEKTKFIKCIILLMETASQSVLFECASTLVAISSAPTAVRAATGCYAQLLRSHGDNNVKLIVLDRLSELRSVNLACLQECVLDLLPVLQSPSSDVQKKAIELILALVTPRTANEVVSNIKKELLRLPQQSTSKQLFIQALQECALRFSDVAPTALSVFSDFIGDSASENATEVVSFARSVVAAFPDLRASVLEKIVEAFDDIKSASVYRSVLWILGQHCTTASEISAAFNAIIAALGQFPLLSEPSDNSAPEDTQRKDTSSGPVLLADGTYKSQSAASSAPATTKPQETFRDFLTSSSFLGTSLSSALVKLVVKARQIKLDAESLNRMIAQSSLVIVGVIRLGTSPQTKVYLDGCSLQKLYFNLRVLHESSPELLRTFLSQWDQAFAEFVKSNATSHNQLQPEKEPTSHVQVDDLITFRQLKATSALTQLEIEDQEFSGARHATGGSSNDFISRLNNITQLTGISEPIHVEVLTTVHQFDLVLDFLFINRTNDTLENILLDLVMSGPLEACERLQPFKLASKQQVSLKVSVKIKAAEKSSVVGTVTFDAKPGSGESGSIDLAEVPISVVNLLRPAKCANHEFVSMWADFEWENAVPLTTSFTDVGDVLQHLIAKTHVECLTSRDALEGDPELLCAKLFAKTVFDEALLISVCFEKQETGKVGGCVRIRSKEKGVALVVGDHVRATFGC
eukprot:c9895_g1_i2.p1 GENE.c9895_g1_i2~~c9895_g1_i2.p1  ORF type:complete len:923 (+),score=252.80 c9895_g1_i2:39-2807(+)